MIIKNIGKMNVLIRYTAAVIAFVLLFTAALLYIPVSAETNPKSSAENTASETVQSSVKSEQEKKDFVIGEQITLEDVSIEGDIAAHPKYVTYPSGRVFPYENELTLTEYGVYTVRYEAEQAGKTLFAYDEFTVYNTLYSIGERSSAHFGKIDEEYYQERLLANCRLSAHTDVFDSDGNPVYDVIDKSGKLKDKEGLMVAIGQGDEFRFNKIIDVSDENGTEPLLSFYCLPEVEAEGDAWRIVIRLTDLYDPENYIEMYMTTLENSSGFRSAVNVGFNGQMAINNWAGGANSQFSPQAQNDVVFEMLYNNSNKRLEPSFGVWSGGPLPNLSDSSKWEEPWEGFTTGECILTIEPVNLSANALNLIIYDIDGQDLSSNILKTDTLPSINIDYAGNDGAPAGIVGKPYRIFDAVAADGTDGNVEVSSKVYFNYESDKPIDIPINDNAFVPTREGTYTIVYTAENSVGRVAQEKVKINVDANKEFSYKLVNRVFGAVSGTTVKLFEDIVPEHARGRVEFVVTARNRSTGKVYEVEAGYTFFPMEAGDYEVTVCGNDYISEKIMKYDLSVSAGKTPAILDDPIVPKYFIKGAKYELPEVSGYCFSSGKAVLTTTEVSIFEDANTEAGNIENDGKYRVLANETVKLVYTVKDGAVSASKEFIIPVVDVGYGEGDSRELLAEKYFYQETGNFEAIKNSEYIRFDTSAASADNGSAKIEFINPLQMDSFVFYFQTFAEATNFDNFNIVLTDIADKNNTLEFSFYRSASGTNVRINGDHNQDYAFPQDIFTPKGERYAIRYTNERGIITFIDAYGASTISVTIKSNKAGESFEGFTDGKAYLSFELEGIEAASSIAVSQINNQMFNSSVVRDRFVPQVTSNDQSGNKQLGESIVIEPIKLSDVLDPDVSASLTVETMDGAAVTADDGTLLKDVDPHQSYKVTPGVGRYRVVYNFSDTSREGEYFYFFTVEEVSVPPVIVLEEADTEAKTGETVNFAGYSVSKDIKVEIWLRTPNAVTPELMEDASGKPYSGFKATQAGTYTVYYTAQDEDGNFVTESYTILVTE